VLTPSIYSLINPKPFNLKLLNLPTTTGVPQFPPIYAADGTIIVPYMCNQTLRISTTFNHQKNYYNTVCNIYHAVYDTLDTHIDNAFKVALPTTPPTIGWNMLMSLNYIFDQMMKTYGRPMPNAMPQNMMTFLSPYNLQNLPEILFKNCTNCQEVAIIANVKHTDKQLLMNIINLLTRSNLYQRDQEDWDRKSDANKMWLNLRLFIQETYQRRLALGTMMAGQGGYTSCNRFAPFQANDATDDNVSDDNTAATIAITINSHMANLSAQTTASHEANVTQINATLQQLATNNAQLHQQQPSLMQQIALLTTNAATTRNIAYVPPPAQIYALPPLHGFQQQSYYPP
jgi:hypothetical protein